MTENQAQYSKFAAVNEAIISPLMAMYKPPSHLDGKGVDIALESYRKALCGYSAEVLEKVWQQVSSKHLGWNWPPLGKFLEVCEKTQPAAEIRNTSEKDHGTHAQCEQVMRSRIGQVALQEGWGNSLWLEVRRTGKTEFTQGDARRFRDAHHRARQAYDELVANERAAGRGNLLGLYEAMQESERELAHKYWNSESVAA